MSGTAPDPAAVAAPVAPNPGVPAATEPGPHASGDSAPALAPAEAPASLSPDVTPAAETPVAAADRPTSILSDAIEAKEPPAAEPPPVEAKPDAPVEEPKAEVAPLAAPVYEAFKLPDGVTLDNAKVTAFSGVLGEYENRIAADPTQAHAAFQELGQKLVDLHISEAQENQQRAARLQRENWDRTIDEWQNKFRDDPEIGRNRQDTTISRIGGLLSLYGQQMGAEREQAVRDAFGVTGAGNHPEIIRAFNWMASRLTERPRVVTPTLPRAPVPGAGSRAQRLYKNTPGAA